MDNCGSSGIVATPRPLCEKHQSQSDIRNGLYTLPELLDLNNSNKNHATVTLKVMHDLPSVPYYAHRCIVDRCGSTIKLNKMDLEGE